MNMSIFQVRLMYLFRHLQEIADLTIYKNNLTICKK